MEREEHGFREAQAGNRIRGRARGPEIKISCPGEPSAEGAATDVHCELRTTVNGLSTGNTICGLQDIEILRNQAACL